MVSWRRWKIVSLLLAALLAPAGNLAAQTPARVPAGVREFDDNHLDANARWPPRLGASQAAHAISGRRREARGNGHGIPSELNNLVTARLVDEWLQGKVR